MKVIITGSTGMVGKAVLLECIESTDVESILIINRHPLGCKSHKVSEILLSDFTDFKSISDQLSGYDACFHCMGVSSIGLNEDEFMHYTYTMTASLVNALVKYKAKMVFNYVSGTGTDSSEHGKVMWARVKGKTENMVFNAGFKDAYAFRPGAILPEKGIKPKTSWYNAIYIVARPLFPLLSRLESVAMSSKLGQAMINSVLSPQTNKLLENRDINLLGE